MEKARQVLFSGLDKTKIKNKKQTKANNLKKTKTQKTKKNIK
jgi:hypothetical protein